MTVIVSSLVQALNIAIDEIDSIGYCLINDNDEWIVN